MAAQNDDVQLETAFTPLADRLTAQEDLIVAELNGAQGKPVDLGGYFQPDNAKASHAMRPSALFNAALAMLG